MAKNQKRDKKNKDKKKGAGGKGLYNPSMPLKGKNLRRVAKQIVKLQTQPEIKAAKAEAKGIRGILGANLKSADAQTQQAMRNTRKFYGDMSDDERRSMAQQRALTARLTGDTAQAGDRSQAAIDSAADASTQRLMASNEVARAEPTAAQNEIQSIIAAQAGRASREAAALEASASSQGANYQGLQNILGSAAQMRGGQQLTDIARAGQENRQDLQEAALPAHLDAKARLSAAKGSRGALLAQTIDALRSGEREYGLSRAAVGLDEAELAQREKASKRTARTSRQNSKRTAATSRANNKRTTRTSRQNTQANIRADKQADKRDDKQELKQDTKQVLNKVYTVKKAHPEWSDERVWRYVGQGDFTQGAIKAAKRRIKKGSKVKSDVRPKYSWVN
jgi:hypothetical protein